MVLRPCRPAARPGREAPPGGESRSRCAPGRGRARARPDDSSTRARTPGRGRASEGASRRPGPKGRPAGEVLGVWRIAHDPAKVGDQVRFLARAWRVGPHAGRRATLHPDGRAAGCKPAWRGFDSHRRLCDARRVARASGRRLASSDHRRPGLAARRSAPGVPRVGSESAVPGCVSSVVERQAMNLEGTGSTPVHNTNAAAGPQPAARGRRSTLHQRPEGGVRSPGRPESGRVPPWNSPGVGSTQGRPEGRGFRRRAESAGGRRGRCPAHRLGDGTAPRRRPRPTTATAQAPLRVPRCDRRAWRPPKASPSFRSLGVTKPGGSPVGRRSRCTRSSE